MEKDVTRHIEEQLSAFLDGELPEEELAMLVRRLERDENYRATLDRYAVIGGALRNDPVGTDVSELRQGIRAALDRDDMATVKPESGLEQQAESGGQVRYLLAASLVVGVMAVFFGDGFNQELTQTPVQGIAQTAVPAPQATPDAVQPQAQLAVAQDPLRARREQELRRIKLNQERMRSYLISHGEYSRPMQGALADSSMYVQQASFSE